MIDPALRAYLDRVKKAEPVLPSDEEITASFTEAGWSPEEIRESIAYLRSTPAEVELKKPEPAPQQPPVTPQVAQPSLPPEVVVTQKPALTNLFPATPKEKEPVAPSSKKPLMWGLLVLVAIVFALIGYAYSQKIWFFKQEPLEVSVLARTIFGRFPETKTYSYALVADLRTEEKDPDAQPLVPLRLVQAQNSPEAGLLPEITPFSIDIASSGSVEAGSLASTTGSANITANVDIPDMITTTLNADIVRENDAVYLKFNEVPSLPTLDLSRIAGAWVKVIPDDLITLGYAAVIANAEETAKAVSGEGEKLNAEMFMRIAEKIDSTALFAFSRSPVVEDLEDRTAYRYDLKIRPQGLVAFVQEMGRLNPVLASSEELRRLGEDPDFRKFADWLEKDAVVTVWTDYYSGLFLKSSFKVRLVPGGLAPALQGKQVVFSGTLGLSDLNKPVVVAVPNETASLDDALVAVSGEDPARYLFKKQSERLSFIRIALESYRIDSGAYPDSLEDLTRPSPGPSRLIFLPVIPKGAYGDSFAYAGSAGNYTLEYEMRLPRFVPRAGALESIAADVTGPVQLTSLGYLPGKNTADRSDVSIEARNAALVDTDADSLTDVLEAYVGFDPRNKDSDGDKTLDRVELLRDVAVAP